MENNTKMTWIDMHEKATTITTTMKNNGNDNDKWKTGNQTTQ
jgi:hypothetical protein